MHRQVGDLTFSPDGLARRGLLLRHLLMPGPAMLQEGKEIVEWVARELGRDTFVNLMPQYFPASPVLGTGEQRSRWACAAFWGPRGGAAGADARAAQWSATHARLTCDQPVHPPSSSVPPTRVHALEHCSRAHNSDSTRRSARLGFVSYEELRARPSEGDYAELEAHARAQGLWRFEEAPRYERAAELARDGELAA
jgi:hypothetical protein